MTALTPALDTALAADVVTFFGAVEINFPDADVRLLDGSAELTLGADLFTGEDETFGALEAIDEFSDGTGDEAPGMVVTLLPAADAAPADIAHKTMQGARVRMWLGVVNPATGIVVDDPYLLFDGEIDRPVIRVGEKSRSVEYECVGGMERLFEAEEGIRLAASWHEQVWPGEKGLRHVTGVQENPYWGQVTPRNGVTYINRGDSGPIGTT